MKKNQNAVKSKELEHVEAEPVEDYHISAGGKIEQTPQEKKRMYRESLIRTVSAALFGILCGIICYIVLDAAVDEFWIFVLVLVMVFTYYVQNKLVFPMLRIDMKLLNWKDWFGIQFLVLIYCLVTWTILLNVNIL